MIFSKLGPEPYLEFGITQSRSLLILGWRLVSFFFFNLFLFVQYIKRSVSQLQRRLRSRKLDLSRIYLLALSEVCWSRALILSTRIVSLFHFTRYLDPPPESYFHRPWWSVEQHRWDGDRVRRGSASGFQKVEAQEVDQHDRWLTSQRHDVLSEYTPTLSPERKTCWRRNPIMPQRRNLTSPR